MVISLCKYYIKILNFVSSIVELNQERCLIQLNYLLKRFIYIYITFFTERFKKSAGCIAKCEVAPTARIRLRVQSRKVLFLFAGSKIDKKFCLGVFLAQKHEFGVFITPKPQEIRFFKVLCKFRRFCKNCQKLKKVHFSEVLE